MLGGGDAVLKDLREGGLDGLEGVPQQFFSVSPTLFDGDEVVA